MTTERLDLFAMSKAEFAASARPRLVTVDAGWFLCVDGLGHPGGDRHAAAREALSAVARSLREASKAAGRDYAVPWFECLWSLEPGYFEFDKAPHSAWNWTLLLRTPDFIGERDLDKAVAGLLDRGAGDAVRRVELMGFEEGRCVQSLCVGPFGKDGPEVRALHAFAEKKGLTVVGRLHEIEASDSRRTASEKFKTVIRLPVI